MTKLSEIMIAGISVRPELIKYINGIVPNSDDVRNYWDEVADEINACREDGRKVCGEVVKKKWRDLKFRLKKKYSSLSEDDDKSNFFTSSEKRALSLFGIYVPDSMFCTTYKYGVPFIAPPPISEELPVINCASMELVNIKKEEESSEDASIKDCDGKTSSSNEESEAQNQVRTPQALTKEFWKRCFNKSKIMTPDTSKHDETELLVAAISSHPDLIDGTSSRSNNTKEAWDDLVAEINPNKCGNMKSGAVAKKKWVDLKYRIKKKYKASLQFRNSDGEKYERLTGFERRILEMIQLNCLTDENFDLPTTVPSGTVSLLRSNNPTVMPVEVKKEVILPEEMPISNNNIGTILPTETVGGGTIFVVQSAMPQMDLTNTGCVVPSADNALDNQVLTIIEMNCPQGAILNNSTTAIGQETIPSTSKLPSEINKPPTELDIADTDTDNEPSDCGSSSDASENILPDIWSDGESEESPFTHAILEEEVDLLLNALKSHPDLIHKVSYTNASRKAWKKITKQLNVKGSGIVRSRKAVRQKWTSLKCRVKKKYMAIQESKFTLENLKGDIKPLSSLDKKVLSLLGIDYSKEMEFQNSASLPSSETPKVVQTSVPSISSTTPAVNATSLVANSTTIVTGTTLTSNSTASTINSASSVNAPAVSRVHPCCSSTSKVGSGHSLVTSMAPIVVNGPTSLVANGVFPSFTSTIPAVNIAESYRIRSANNFQVSGKAKLLERQKSTARVNFHRRERRTIQQKKDDELLTLKRESLKIRKQALEEQRKTNIILRRLLQLKCQEMKVEYMEDDE